MFFENKNKSKKKKRMRIEWKRWNIWSGYMCWNWAFGSKCNVVDVCNWSKCLGCFEPKFFHFSLPLNLGHTLQPRKDLLILNGMWSTLVESGMKDLPMGFTLYLSMWDHLHFMLACTYLWISWMVLWNWLCDGMFENGRWG